VNQAEIIIAENLRRDPKNLQVTSDYKKLYFLLNGHLMYMTGNFQGMTADELAESLEDALRNVDA
jgi:recombinational DNA repair protein RecR